MPISFFRRVSLVLEVFQDTWRSNKENPSGYWHAKTLKKARKVLATKKSKEVQKKQGRSGLRVRALALDGVQSREPASDCI